jgi:hypothetical protein
MREKFANRKLEGSIKIKMDRAKGYWEGDKYEVIQNIVSIANEYLRDNYVLTLRQLYYQLVARDIVPNHDKVYAKISSIKDDVVYSGLVDWEVFEDRGRVPMQAYYEYDVKDALQRTINSYKLNRQLGQKNHIEVWTEKDAISSILKRATNPKTIRLVVNKGYTSSTAIYESYGRFLDEIENGKKVKILYFGDHDPSGIDMIRDITERVTFMFINGEQFSNRFEDQIQDWWEKERMTLYDVADIEGYEDVAKLALEENEKAEELFEAGRRLLYIQRNDLFEVIPVGLTMQQIKEYKPPHNPAKITDPRAKGYIRKYGAVSWEVDALRPEIMLSIVNKAINEYMDLKQFNYVIERENEEKDTIVKMIDSLE